MDNILEQIQSLTDKFNNLFEVEGLGDPSGDVPPSTNKIKKDKKTKDGKVELVSVEDELFPKEGNAKEQFRQKIIDKINGIIQGTATLEDLLQLVRSKQVKPVKEGFEGAIELLEEIINEVSNKTVERALNKSGDKVVLGLMGKIPNDYKNIKQYKELSNLANKRAEKHGEKVEQDPDTGWHKHVKEGFEGAVEILEEIINEVSVGALARATENNFKKRQEAHKKSTEALKKAHDNYEEQSRKHPEDEPALYNAVSKLGSATRKEGEKASHANDLANLNLPKDSKVSANKLFGKADKTYAKRGKEVDKALDKGKGRGDKEFDAPMKKYSRAVDLAVADPVVSRRTNGGANESFKQAISVLEKLISERKYSEEEIKEIAKKVCPERAKKFNKACDELNKVTQGKNPDNFTSVQKYRANKAAGKVERAEDRLNHAQEVAGNVEKTPYGLKIKEAQEILEKITQEQHKEAGKKVLDDRKREYLSKYANVLDGADIYGSENVPDGDIKDLDRAKKRYKHAKEVANESFEQAISQMEDLINCLGESKSATELSSVAKKVLPQREAEAKQAHANLDHAMKINPYSMINGKLSQRQREVISNALNKAQKADNKVEHAKSYLEKPKEKQPSGIKFDRILCSHEDKTNEGLFIEDGRGDLIDDVSKVITGKTVKQHIVGTAKKLINGKKKVSNEAFDSFKIKGYNEEELVKLVEEVINEISDKKYREKLEELKDGIKKAKEFQKDTKDEIIKDKLDDAIIPQEHRLNVSQDKYEDRVVKREKEKYERSKAKKGK